MVSFLPLPLFLSFHRVLGELVLTQLVLLSITSQGELGPCFSSSLNHSSSTSGSLWWPGHKPRPLHPSHEGTHRGIGLYKEHKRLEAGAKGSS